MNALRFFLKLPLFLFFFKSGRRLMALAVLISVLAVLFCHFGPQPFEKSPMQERIGEELVEKAVDQFPWNREVGSVLMVADVEAWSPFFQDAIREKVTNYRTDGSRKFDILPDPFTARVMKTLGFKNTTGKLSDDDVRRIISTMEADTLLLVSFTSRDYVEDADSASGRLACTFYVKGKPEPIRINVSAALKKHSGAWGRLAGSFRRMTTAGKLLWGVLGAVLFPFLMAPVTLSVVRLRSAKANGLMVFAYAALLFLFEGALFSAPTGILQALIMCAWGISIVWYLLKTCDLLASPEFRQRMQLQRGK